MISKCILAGACLFFSVASYAEDCVVLLHGLASHPLVMKPMELAIDIQPEFRVVNKGYNSYSGNIQALADRVVPEAIARCELKDGEKISFVTHSMGGLLARAYLAETEVPALNSVIMIAPPNQGSEIVDWLQQYPPLVSVLGPAGSQLGTGDHELPATLPQPEFSLGVIAGTQSNSLFWRKQLPGKNDGKVSTDSVKTKNLNALSAYYEVKAKHAELLFERETLAQVLSFLRYGSFGVNQVACSATELRAE